MRKSYLAFMPILLSVINMFVAVAVLAATAQKSHEGNNSDPSAIVWKPIASGVAYAAQKLIDKPSVSDGTLHIVRIDPLKAKLRSLMSSAMDKQRRTARKWCTEFGMIAVINAGMFDTDYLTHIGYMRSGDHVNNAKWAKEYNSILVFDPLRTGLPVAQVFDNVKNNGKMLQNYGTVIQNLRMIKGRGENVWKDKPRKWSEAAIAFDTQGRVLFLFMRSPLSVYQFNEKILALPLKIVRAMHLEGGPEASLSICTNTLQLDLSGSYETDFLENDSNWGQWDLPNVIGVIAE